MYRRQRARVSGDAGRHGRQANGHERVMPSHPRHNRIADTGLILAARRAGSQLAASTA